MRFVFAFVPVSVKPPSCQFEVQSVVVFSLFLFTRVVWGFKIRIQVVNACLEKAVHVVTDKWANIKTIHSLSNTHLLANQ